MTISSNIASYNSDHSYYSISNAAQGYANSTSSNYATVNLTRGSGASTYIYWEFDLPTIPTGSTIDSISCNYRAGVSSTSTRYISSATIQMCSDKTTKGSSKSIMSTSPSASSFTTAQIGTWTVAEINAGVKLKTSATRGTSSTNSNYSIRFYGADISITYTEPVSGNTVYIKVEGTWKEANDVLVKSGGSWKSLGDVYKKVNGSWVQQSDKSDVFDQDGLYISALPIYKDSNLIMNLDGITSYNGRYTDSGTGDIVYPIGISGNFMRAVDITANGTSFEFNGSTSYMRPSASATFDNYLYNTHTIEVCFEQPSLSDGDVFTIYVGRASNSIALYGYYYQDSMYFIRSSTVGTKMLQISPLSVNQIHYIGVNNNGWMVDGIYYSDSSLTTSTSSLQINDIVMVSGQYKCASIGMRFRSDKDPQPFKGKIYALRIHNALLTEAQMMINMKADIQRFS